MASGAVATKIMKNTLLNRAFKSSPDYTAYSKGAIGVGTTTPTVNDSDLESVISGWNDGSDYKDYETSYPAFNEAEKKVTTRTFVTANDANGNTISEFCDFNTDISPRVGGHFVFSGITKTSSIQVYITTTYKFT